MGSKAPASVPMPLATAFSILSLGMLALCAFSMKVRNAGEFTSPFEALDSTVMRRESLPQTPLLSASAAPFWCFICDHLLCPDISALYSRPESVAKSTVLYAYVADEIHRHGARLNPRRQPRRLDALRRDKPRGTGPVSYTHLRAHETGRNLVCR